MKKLSESERACWAFIEENIDSIQHLTMIEVARKSYTSLATVGRTIRKMGYDSYFELKLASKNSVNEDHKESGGFSFEVNSIIDESKNEVLQTLNRLCVEDIETAVELLLHSKIISIFANEGSSLVARDAEKKLRLSGKQVNIYENYECMNYYSKIISRDSLILCISLNGENPEIISAVTIAKSRQIKILTITSNFESSLALMSDVCLVGYSFRRKEVDLGLDVDSRLCLSLLIRLLVDCLAIRKRFGKIRD